MSETSIGTFYGVGLGPGDPELLTRKAMRVLSEVDWIFYPFEARTGTSFSRRILTALAVPTAKCRQVSLGMSQDRGPDQYTYATVAEAMAREVRQGKSVAWVTQGDPLFYSTFIHLYLEMRRRFPDVPITIVPGVTSPSAAAAAAYGLDHLPALLDDFATVFLMKVNTVFDQLLETLAVLPYRVHAVYAEQVSTPEERLVTDLYTLRGQKLSYFSLVILRQDKSALGAAQQKEDV